MLATAFRLEGSEATRLEGIKKAIIGALDADGFFIDSTSAISGEGRYGLELFFTKRG